MAERTTTTKQATVWKPPRLTMLKARGVTRSGTRGTPGDQDWEVFSGPSSCTPKPDYRMPTSSEPSSFRPDC